MKPSRKMGIVIFIFSLVIISIITIMGIIDYFVTKNLKIGLFEIILGIVFAIFTGVWGFQSVVNHAKVKYKINE